MFAHAHRPLMVPWFVVSGDSVVVGPDDTTDACLLVEPVDDYSFGVTNSFASDDV